MLFFRLDSESVKARVETAGSQPVMVSRTSYLVQGALGFGLVGVLAFAVWAVGGRWLVSHFGVGGFYGLIAVVFVGLAGLALGRLVLGPGAMARFYGLFTLGFVAYSIGWCALYFSIGGKLGEIFGSAVGLAALTWIFLSAFKAGKQFLSCWGVLFLMVTLGYYLGEPFHTWFPGAVGILIWGFCYGTGFGAGIGYVLFEAQQRTRELLGAAGAEDSLSSCV